MKDNDTVGSNFIFVTGEDIENDTDEKVSVSMITITNQKQPFLDIRSTINKKPSCMDYYQTQNTILAPSINVPRNVVTKASKDSHNRGYSDYQHPIKINRPYDVGSNPNNNNNINRKDSYLKSKTIGNLNEELEPPKPVAEPVKPVQPEKDWWKFWNWFDDDKDKEDQDKKEQGKLIDSNKRVTQEREKILQLKKQNFQIESISMNQTVSGNFHSRGNSGYDNNTLRNSYINDNNLQTKNCSVKANYCEMDDIDEKNVDEVCDFPWNLTVKPNEYFKRAPGQNDHTSRYSENDKVGILEQRINNTSGLKITPNGQRQQQAKSKYCNGPVNPESNQVQTKANNGGNLESRIKIAMQRAQEYKE